MAPQFGQKFTLNDALIEQRLDDELVILNPETGEACNLDALSAVVWDIMQDIGDFSEIRNILLESFDIKESQLTADLDIFYMRLLSLGFIYREE